jgi:two-component system sensor histidine kinase RpfC
MAQELHKSRKNAEGQSGRGLSPQMSAISHLKSRLAARTDSEHEQAFLRFVIVGFFAWEMVLFVGPKGGWTEMERVLSNGLFGFWTVAIAILAAICIWPAKNVTRRILGMLSDVGGATFYVWLAGENGVWMICVYLFVTFGNGFRYGRHYLFGCQLLSLVGFVVARFAVPYWQQHHTEWMGLLAALVVLPLYVSTLLKRIEQAKARAEEANRAKTTFLANMSHEIRTPLNGIVGVVDLFQATVMSPQQSELARLMRHSVSVLRSLVDDVLDITKIEAGRISIEVAPFDLHVTLNGLVHLLRPHAQAKGLVLRATVDPMLDYRLRGDSHHLRQVLLNLLGNAIKFTERGEVTIAVMQVKESTDGVTARFEVRDTGIGIAPNAIERIFERFSQADDSVTRRYGGSGLGTTIAKQLVELMGGTIGVASKVGEGSTFWIELPLLKDVSSAEHPIEPIAANDELTLLIGDGSDVARVKHLVDAVGGRLEVLPTASVVGTRVQTILDAGAGIRAIVVAGTVETACMTFNAAVQKLGEQPVALIHISQVPLSVVDTARIRSIRDAVTFGPDVLPRAFTNAVHAATAIGSREGAEIIDLAAVLKQQRTSLRVLVAEDNLTNQTIICKLLEHAGHTVILAVDGEAALDCYEKEQPDIALLDFNMPIRTGIEVIKTIRVMEPAGEHLPTILLSASVTSEARDRAKSAGADEFVGKPFEAAALLQTIDRLTRRKSRISRTTTRTRSAGPVVDFELALIDSRRMAELEGIARDSSFLTELLRGFKIDVEAIFGRLDAPIASGQWGAVHDLMHTLKGAAVGIGAQQLAARCDEFDAAVSAGHTGQLAEQNTELRKCFDATLVQLNTYTLQKHRISL